MNTFKAGVGGMARATYAERTAHAAETARPGWWAAAPGAEAVLVGEALVGLALWIALPDAGDPYGRDTGVTAVALLFFMPIVCVVGGLLLLGGAFLHAMLFTRPALALAERTGRPWAAVVWLHAASALGALAPWAYGAPYVDSWFWITAAGVLPLGVAGRALRTGRAPASVVARTGLATGLIAFAAAVAVVAGQGAPEGYEPPELGRAAYVGEWRGAAGGTVRLREDGTARVDGVPMDAFRGGAATCTATGTWVERPSGTQRARRAGVDLTVRDCDGYEEAWEVAGSAGQPELFQLYGDPDQGALWLLRKA
ncbi:hypothetical protein BGK67_19205 [Streptomyces subrutilus]|uniref:Uncharacterized protein n=1 Tax=Streptomyces subrutilus TaxID=36818 RepID=A0A1E5PUF1_9ACTN|nr:hypothetical protein BGK67_19205 [Streptomyces subrutilus]